ncbi:hypothetical protein [Georhizobium profundi]|uniref:hypothetical protein n=1 Tax=Georhizobium profundi TaxID=2341112 RepID=UPI001FE02F74|nr:hypothetical protein [Georhizobium profundi]
MQRTLSARTALLAATLIVVPCTLAHAQAASQSPADSPAVAQPTSPQAAALTGEISDADPLDGLFANLKRVSDPAEGRRIVREIWAEWGDSGSATVNVLMQWATEAMEDERYGTALDLLDQVTVLKPDFPEGFNKRATLHFMMDDHAKSLADIHRVLSLEPRHFGALSGMAAIMTEAGNDRLALRAYERVLEIYPSDRNAQGKVVEIEDKIEGDPV